jgi:hypothetical protein
MMSGGMILISKQSLLAQATYFLTNEKVFPCSKKPGSLTFLNLIALTGQSDDHSCPSVTILKLSDNYFMLSARG